jgi:hypothetical protein
MNDGMYFLYHLQALVQVSFSNVFLLENQMIRLSSQLM